MTNYIRTDNQAIRDRYWARMAELTHEVADLTHKVRLARSFLARCPDAPQGTDRLQQVTAYLSSLQSELNEIYTALGGQDNFEW